jgi:hypothetical protein
MKPALVFGLLGLVCAFYCRTLETTLLQLLCGSLAICWLGVASAYAGVGAKTFGKQRSGRLSLWSILFWSYHLLNALSLRLFRQGAKENAFDSIEKNVLLGCQLSARDKTELSRYNIQAVLDTHAPMLEQLKEGAGFIEERTKDGAVYVHCALGHGRSALFVAAYLIQTGSARTADEAVQQVKAKRANIELSGKQLALLRQFARFYE